MDVRCMLASYFISYFLVPLSPPCNYQLSHPPLCSSSIDRLACVGGMMCLYVVIGCCFFVGLTMEML